VDAGSIPAKSILEEHCMAGPGYSSGWYDYRTEEICLSAWRDEARTVERVPFRWYFYVLTDDLKRVYSREFEGMIDGVEPDGRSHGRYSRVYMDHAWGDRRRVVKWLQDKRVMSYEADMRPLNRYLTDEPVKFDSSPRLLWYDFETDARAGFGSLGEHRILLVTYRRWNWDAGRPSARSEYLVQREGYSERDLLMDFFDVVGQHDVLIAWNGDFYDEQVLRKRCRNLGIRVPWQMINFLDHMQVYKRMYGRDEKGEGVKVSFALGKVAQRVLGMTKLDTLVGKGWNPAEQVVWLHKHDRDALIEYGLRDTDLMVDLEAKDRYIDAVRVQSHLCNRFLSSWSLRSGYLGDAFVTRYGTEHGRHFNTKMHSFNTDDEKLVKKLEKITGARVIEPKSVGLHEGVQLTDFASLYPSIMRSFNISPETKIGEDGKFEEGLSCAAANGAVFTTEVKGVFPAIVAEAVQRRAPYKAEVERLKKAGKHGTEEWLHAKHLSDGYKTLSNTLYGILAAMFLRYYDKVCGEAVTLTGQAVLGMLEAKAAREGYLVLAGDTDSTFLQCGDEELERFNAEFADEVDEWVASRGGKPGFIRLDAEKVYERLLFVAKKDGQPAKKRYAGRVRGERTLDIKGLEVVRSDGCRLERELQKRVLEYVLFVDEPDPRAAGRIVERCRDNLFTGAVGVEWITITQSVNKELDEYKAENVHVRIARWLLNTGREVYTGMKVPYVLTGKEDGRQQAVHAGQFDGNYDPYLYWKKIYPPTRRVLEAAFPAEDWAAFEKARPRRRRGKGKKGKRWK